MREDSADDDQNFGRPLNPPDQKRAGEATWARNASAHRHRWL
jgi:hypothetical protein